MNSNDGGGNTEAMVMEINSPLKKKTINDHFNVIHSAGKGERTNTGERGINSPVRKKTKKTDRTDSEGEGRSEKRKKVKKKKNSGKSKKDKTRKSAGGNRKLDMADKELEDEDTDKEKDEERATPVLRRGRFSLRSGGTGKKQARNAPIQNHAYKRWVVDCSLVLKSEGLDKYPEMQHALKMLLTNGRKVDSTLIIKPVVEGVGDKIDCPEDIPINFTELSGHFKMSGGLCAFQMKIPWKRMKIIGRRRNPRIRRCTSQLPFRLMLNRRMWWNASVVSEDDSMARRCGSRLLNPSRLKPRWQFIISLTRAIRQQSWPSLKGFWRRHATGNRNWTSSISGKGRIFQS